MNIIEIRKLSHRAFHKGYIVVFDVKVGWKVEADRDFVRSDQALSFCTEALFEHYAALPDEDDPKQRPIRDIETEDEVLLGFQETSSDFMFFALGERFDQASLEEVLEACKERCFFMPQYIIQHGKVVFYEDAA
ncbi:hypothetical protein [Vreelandella sp. EE22]